MNSQDRALVKPKKTHFVCPDALKGDEYVAKDAIGRRPRDRLLGKQSERSPCFRLFALIAPRLGTGPSRPLAPAHRGEVVFALLASVDDAVVCIREVASVTGVPTGDRRFGDF